MRFLRVTFRNFGPFTEQALDLDAPGRMCVVFGPNEAGKSSALRGLQAFLFGFPVQSKDNFRYQHKQFRVHAVLESAAGEQLECIRRKGKKETLRMPCDQAVVPDHVLAEYLGGLDEEQFEALFGLGADRLVEGGQDIAIGKGDIGTLLFEAGAGMKGLRLLAQKLEAQQRELYTVGGKKQTITEGLRHYREQKEAERDAELTPEEFARVESLARDARDQVARLITARREVRARRDLLGRYHAALPAIGLLQSARERFEAVADAPILAVDFATRLANAHKQHESAQQEAVHLAGEQERLRKELEEAEPPAALLREEQEIVQLKIDVGGEAKRLQEEVRAKTFSTDALGKARDIFRDLTGSTAWHEMDDLKPRDDERNRIIELANQRSAIELAVKHEDETLQQLAVQLDQAIRSRDATRQLDDPTPWQSLVDDIAAHGALEQECEQLAKAVAEQEQKLAAEFTRMQPIPALHWQAAVAHPVPLAELIETFHSEFATHLNSAKLLSKELDQCRRELDSVRSNFVNQLGGEPVPSIDELTAARRDRDAGLHYVRERLDGRAEASREADFTSRHTPNRPLMDAVESATRHTDNLADRLRNEADRVAAAQTLQHQESQLQNRLAELSGLLDESNAARAELDDRWRSAWERTGVVPDTPAVMRSWLNNWNKFCDGVTAWHDDNRRLQEKQECVTALRQKLAESCSASRSARSLVEAVAACRQAITAARTARDEAQKAAAEVNRCENEIAQARSRLERATQRKADWHNDWAKAVAVLRLTGPQPSVETAQSYLDSIALMQQHLKDMRIKDARVGELRAEREAVLKRLNEVRARLDPASVTSTAETMGADFRTLESALDDARERRTQRQALTKQLKVVDDKLAKAEERLRDARATLQALAKEAGVGVDELYDAVARARERSTAAQSVEENERALAVLARGEPHAEFEAAALAHRDDLDGQLDELRGQIEQLDQDVSAAEAAARAAEDKLGEYSQASSAAAEARQQAVLVAAKLEDELKEYAALVVARAALERAKERYRAQHQDTLLARAGEYFKTLTNHAFSGIEIEHDDGRDFLVAVRASANQSDDRVTVDGLSDGTRDQLFLAFRLAGIEQHLRDHGPFPLIVDDVLINFDDERARATFHCLSALARQTQVIVFTHHRHLVELAQAVDPDAHRLDLLPRG